MASAAAHRAAAVLLLSAMLLTASALPDTTTILPPGQVWTDTSGKAIQAHGAGVLLHGGTYYWYGEDKSKPQIRDRVDVSGVRCYSSTDLHSWKDEGLVLTAEQHPDIAPSRVVERPKVIYNEATQKFVMWLHVDSADYKDALAGVAWSASPTGPFTYMGSLRPNGEESRDLTVFKDDDGTAYLFYSSQNNKILHVTRLSADYLGVEGKYWTPLTPIGEKYREAPAVFKSKGRYYLLTSGCTGWDPNRSEVYTAPSLEGPWATLGDPCQGDSATCAISFQSQGAFVLPLPGDNGRFVMLADRWNKANLTDSRYVWLPLTVSEEQGASQPEVMVTWHDSWGLQCKSRGGRRAGKKASCTFVLT